jgi:hypothetical protein
VHGFPPFASRVAAGRHLRPAALLFARKREVYRESPAPVRGRVNPHSAPTLMKAQCDQAYRHILLRLMPVEERRLEWFNNSEGDENEYI